MARFVDTCGKEASDMGTKGGFAAGQDGNHHWQDFPPNKDYISGSVIRERKYKSTAGFSTLVPRRDSIPYSSALSSGNGGSETGSRGKS